MAILQHLHFFHQEERGLLGHIAYIISGELVLKIAVALLPLALPHALGQPLLPKLLMLCQDVRTSLLVRVDAKQPCQFVIKLKLLL